MGSASFLDFPLTATNFLGYKKATCSGYLNLILGVQLQSELRISYNWKQVLQVLKLGGHRNAHTPPCTHINLFFLFTGKQDDLTCRIQNIVLDYNIQHENLHLHLGTQMALCFFLETQNPDGIIPVQPLTMCLLAIVLSSLSH